jgi:hypothetical protein
MRSPSTTSILSSKRKEELGKESVIEDLTTAESFFLRCSFREVYELEPLGHSSCASAFIKKEKL